MLSENLPIKDPESQPAATLRGRREPTPTHPVPLSVLVEQDDDQLRMQLVSILTERQIPPLERHIHQVPAEGNIDDGGSQTNAAKNLHIPS